MKIKRTHLIAGIVIVAVFGIAIAKIASRSTKGDPRRQIIPTVRVEKPTRDTVNYTLQSTGDVVAIQQAGIFSKVSGNLERVFVDIGTRVGRGQLLAIIDTTVLAQQAHQTEATYTNARSDYERKKQLVDENLLSKQDLDNAEAALKVAQANYETAKTQLSYAHITAPFTGTVTKRFLDPGALVNPSSSTLFTLMDLDSVKVVVNVLEKDVPLITIGEQADVTADALPDQKYEGRVGRMSEAVDPATRTMAVEVFVPNKGHLLKPGMYSTVTLVLSQHPNAITVPTQAVLKDANGPFVYAVENKTARRVPVQPGIEQSSRVEITSGLTGSETLITTGQQFVRDGGPVAVQP